MSPTVTPCGKTLPFLSNIFLKNRCAYLFTSDSSCSCSSNSSSRFLRIFFNNSDLLSPGVPAISLKNLRVLMQNLPIAV